MKKLLLILLLLIFVQFSFAQSFFHRQLPVPSSPGNISLTQLVSLADGNFCLAYYNDSMFSLLKMDTLGNVLSKKAFVVKPSTADTGRYSYFGRFIPVQDSGMLILCDIESRDNLSADSNKKIMIRLDKQLNVKWALGKTLDQASAGDFYIKCAASDNAGNIMANYSLASGSGICKISPLGNILMDKASSLLLGNNAFATAGNRFLFMDAQFDVNADTSVLTVFSFDDQINLMSSKKYKLDKAIYIQPMMSDYTVPVYNQPLIAGAAFQTIPYGATDAVLLPNCYFLLDTPGNLLQLKYTPATIGWLSPVDRATIDPASNVIHMSGDKNTPIIYAMDTSGNFIYSHDIGMSALYPQCAPKVIGNNAYLFAQTFNGQSVPVSNDLVRYKKDGSAFCEGKAPFPHVQFINVPAHQQVMSAPSFTTGTLTLDTYDIDTFSLPLPSIQTLCSTTAVGEIVPTREHGDFCSVQHHQGKVSLPAAAENANIEIYDIAGRRLVNRAVTANEIVELGDTPHGVYVWKLDYQLYNHSVTDKGKFITE
ncbi:T9SS type A sorting domain-containing protein [Chitinophagaceae bacterium MMS25-I14]